MKTLVRLVVGSVFACAVALPSLPAAGQLNVGDKPTLKVPAAGGGTIDLEKMKGKLVLIDFWATWCGPCLAEAPHMVEVNNKYGPKGLQVIGISLDQDAAEMAAVAKEKGFTWPQHVDSTNQVSGQFGVNGIPHVYLLGPEGTVLWHGHPARMDAEIERAFKEHPPQLVDPKVLKAAQELLTEAEKKAEAGDAQGALKAMSRIAKGARADKEFAAKLDETGKKLEAAADKLLADVDAQIEKGEYVVAIDRLKALSSGLGDLPVAAKAKKRLDEVIAKPQAKAALELAAKEVKATEELAVAQRLKDSAKHEMAYPRFKTIAKTFAGTKSAATASKAVAEYEKDKAFVKRVAEKESAVKAKGALNIARNYAKNGRNEQARKKYQTVIDQYPGTSVAETAKKEMAALPQ